MAMTALLYRVFAQVYGAGSYNSAVYGGSATSGGSGNTLTNTGIAIIAIVTVAALLLLAAVVVRIWRRPNKSVAVDVKEDSENEL